MSGAWLAQGLHSTAAREFAMARKFDPWLAAAVTLYAANIIGWVAWALWRGLVA